MTRKPKTATLEGVRQMCLERKSRLSDEVVSVKSLFMDPDQPGLLVVRRPGGGKEDSYQMNNRVYQQASGVVYGLPGGYLKKLVNTEDGDPALAAANFNHWVNVSKDKEVLLRFEQEQKFDNDGNVEGVNNHKTLRAMLSSSWNPIPYEESVAAMIGKFGPDHQVQVTRFNSSRIVLDFVTRKLDIKTDSSQHVFVDDPFEWGMRFVDSDVGLSKLEMSPYTRRLICLNGMSSMSRGCVMSISHSGKASATLEEVMSNVRQGIELVDGYSQRVVEQIVASSDIKLALNDETQLPLGALERVNKDNAVTRLEDKYVREAWALEAESIPEPTVYRLANSYTRAGTHGEELGDEQRLRLQAVGGRVLEYATTNYNWN